MNKEPLQNQSRRQFIKLASAFAVAIPSGVILNSFCEAQSDRHSRQARERIGGYCEGCEAIYEGMPEQLSWQTTIAPAGERGESLEISGIIYKPNGKTPAPNIVLYVYHTDVAGYYSPAPNATGNARRHGHLRGWMKTNAKGEYKFTTIKPAPYPGRGIPSHIHPILKEDGKNEYYVDEYVFDDDPLLTQKERANHRNFGGSGVLRLTKNSGGVWIGRRDITLGLNVPNYY